MEKVLKKGRRYIKLALETNARKTAGSPPGMTKVKPDGTYSSRLPNKIMGAAIEAVNPNRRLVIIYRLYGISQTKFFHRR